MSSRHHLLLTNTRGLHHGILLLSRNAWMNWRIVWSHWSLSRVHVLIRTTNRRRKTGGHSTIKWILVLHLKRCSVLLWWTHHHLGDIWARTLGCWLHKLWSIFTSLWSYFFIRLSSCYWYRFTLFSNYLLL